MAARLLFVRLATLDTWVAWEQRWRLPLSLLRVAVLVSPTKIAWFSIIWPLIQVYFLDYTWQICFPQNDLGSTMGCFSESWGTSHGKWADKRVRVKKDKKKSPMGP